MRCRCPARFPAPERTCLEIDLPAEARIGVGSSPARGSPGEGGEANPRLHSHGSSHCGGNRRSDPRRNARSALGALRARSSPAGARGARRGRGGALRLCADSWAPALSGQQWRRYGGCRRWELRGRGRRIAMDGSRSRTRRPVGQRLPLPRRFALNRGGNVPTGCTAPAAAPRASEYPSSFVPRERSGFGKELPDCRSMLRKASPRSCSREEPTKAIPGLPTHPTKWRTGLTAEGAPLRPPAIRTCTSIIYPHGRRERNSMMSWSGSLLTF